LGWLLRLEPTAYFMSYGGIAYDLMVGPLLLFRRTLKLGLLSTLFFHLSNKAVFNIGIFPWLMIASTTLFFSPEWPRRLIDNVFLRRPYRFENRRKASFWTTKIFKLSNKQKLALAAFALFMAFWVLFPLRHYILYKGDVVWNEQGHNYSWRMKLRDKQCGCDAFGYTADGNISFSIPMYDFVPSAHVRKILPRPWMIIQMAHLFAESYTTTNGVRPEIYMHVRIYYLNI
jgi:vitamin K-dependent gamma-carboxylase